MIKLIATDMDGTLLRKDRTVSPANKQAIQQAVKKGIHFAFCTGRTSPGVRPYADEIFAGMQEEYYLILGGGTDIRRGSDNKQLLNNGLGLAEYAALLADAQTLTAQLVAYLDNCIYTTGTRISTYMLEEFGLVRMPVQFVTVADLPENICFSKLQFVDAPNIITQTMQNISTPKYRHLSCIRTTPNCIEITPKSASKGSALRFLSDYLSLQAENVMAIGDHSNDISMIEYAGTGVAVGNATQQLKQLATCTVATNEEDGVAQAIALAFK